MKVTLVFDIPKEMDEKFDWELAGSITRGYGLVDSIKLVSVHKEKRGCKK